MFVNLFAKNDDDFKYLLANFGEVVRVNNQGVKAVVTNTPIEEYDDKYVSTRFPLKRGDHVLYKEMDYFVINEVETKRYDRYKAIIRRCPHKINFNVSKYTNPTSGSYISYDVKRIPAIVLTTKDLGLNYNQMIGVYLPDGQMAIYVQDNSDTRKIFSGVSDSEQKNIHNIVFIGKAWKIIGADLTKKGLIMFNVQATTFGSNDDKVNEIAWIASHAGWNGVIDDSFYNDGGSTPLPPVGGANLGTINLSSTSCSGNDGTVKAEFIKDDQAVYFRITLYRAEDNSLINEYITASAEEVSHTFNGLDSGSYYVTVESFDGSKYLASQQSSTVNVSTNWI